MTTEEQVAEACAVMSKRRLLTGRRRTSVTLSPVPVRADEVEYWTLCWEWDQSLSAWGRWWAALIARPCGTWAWRRAWRETNPADRAQLELGETYPNPPPYFKEKP